MTHRRGGLQTWPEPESPSWLASLYVNVAARGNRGVWQMSAYRRDIPA